MALVVLVAPVSAALVAPASTTSSDLHALRQASLYTAGALTDSTSLPEAVRIGTGWQADVLGVNLVAPELSPGLPSAEIAALLPEGISADPAELAALDVLPAVQRDSLARVIASFRAYAAATDSAFAAVPADADWIRQATDPSVKADPSAFSGLLAGSGPVLGSRLALFDAAEAFRSAFETHSSSSTLDLCPYIALDLTGTSDVYHQDCVLVIDVGGDDTYYNNAGGSRIDWAAPGECIVVPDTLVHNSAALIDLAGNDIHEDSIGCGVSGGGLAGSGFLYDAAGADYYRGPTNGVAGGANAGWGFLYDASGNDNYAVQDIYDGGLGLHGGAGRGGVGALFDGGGDDTYFGSQQGANGGADTASVGLLYDGGGNDQYSAGSQSTNGGSSEASHGMLVDAGGNDQYASIDSCSFNACDSVNGGGVLGAVGFLYDATGDDAYTAESAAANGGGGLGGAGTLIDLDGDDEYTVYSDQAPNGGGGVFFTAATIPGIGLLLDYRGTDEYYDQAGGTGTDRTVVPKGLVGAQIDLAELPVPDPRIHDNGDGSYTVYDDADHDGERDVGETGVDTPPAPSGNGLAERTLLHEEGVGVDPEPLPPAGFGGQPVPDVPGQPGQPVPDVPAQPGQPVPDVPSTPGQPLPDHGGVGPVPTPEVGQEVGVLSLRDAGANYCAYFTPEGGSEQLLTCIGRAFLGPLDPSAPRGDTPLVFYDPPDVPATGPIVTPDVPGTPPVVTPDVPGTPPVTTPNVPPTPGQPTPDVPAVAEGSLGNSPGVTLDIDVSYRYDEARLAPFLNAGGVQTWSPVGPTPSDLQWLAAPGNPAALTVTVAVYEDGVHQGTVSHAVPALGQALAAAERTAGTLP